jgi:hypothetical protein
MAAVTVTKTVDSKDDVWVGLKRRFYKISAPANGDTLTVTGAVEIVHVDITFNDAAAVAADSVSYTSSGNVITFAIAGTGRALDVMVVYRSA